MNVWVGQRRRWERYRSSFTIKNISEDSIVEIVTELELPHYGTESYLLEDILNQSIPVIDMNKELEDL